MADQTYTVTVASGTLYISGGTGNVFYLDGVRTMDVKWVKGGTLRFDQSDATNNMHPLLFTNSTSDPGNNIITSGVTYYLDGASNQSDYTNLSNFNSATVRYIEIAPATETDFHFYCYIHGIGMGGAVDLTQNTYGAGSWSTNNWGAQNSTTEVLSGLSISSALGELAAYPENGWGHSFWGSEPWGESYSPVVPLTGLSMSTALGTLPYAQSIEGWGRDEYGIGGWGTNETVVELTTSLSMDMSQGPEAWGESAWGSDVLWGGELVITPESIIGITGLEVTSSIGTTTQDFDMNFDVTGVSSGVALGTLDINDGTDHVVGLGSVTIGSAIGSVVNEQAYDLSSQSMAFATPGALNIDDTQIVPVSGVTTASQLGSVDVDNISVGLTGIAASFAVGSTTVADMTVGLTGIEFNSNLGETGFGALAYKDIDITATTTYTDITHAA